MKPRLRISVLLFAAALFLPQLHATALQPIVQDQGPPQAGGMGGDFQDHSVRGDITAISGSTLTVKTDDGQVYSVATSVNTRFRKQRDLIKITDLHVGDMIAAIGDKDPKAKTLGAVFVVVIDKAQYEQMRADFGKTWTAGVVQSIKGTDIVIKRPDNVTQTVSVDENTEFRRRREDITLPDIKVGDNISARGALQNGNFLATTVNVGRPGGFAGGNGEYRSRPAPATNSPQPNN